MDILGMDIGASKIEYGRWKGGERMLEVRRLEIVRGIGRERMLALLLDAAAGAKTEAVGIGVPGFVRGGRIEALPNWPGLEKTDLSRMFARRLRVPVFVENDVKCMALAIWQERGRRKDDSFVVVAPGSGIGGAIVREGRLVRGAHNAAGEFGHMKMVAMSEGQLQAVEWEQLCGGLGVEQQYDVRAGARLSAREILDSDEPAARAIAQEAAKYFALGLINVADALDPGEIVLAGSVAVAYWGKWRESVRNLFEQHANTPARDTKIGRTALERPALLGAAMQTQMGNDAAMARFFGE